MGVNKEWYVHLRDTIGWHSTSIQRESAYDPQFMPWLPKFFEWLLKDLIINHAGVQIMSALFP